MVDYGNGNDTDRGRSRALCTAPRGATRPLCWRGAHPHLL